MEGFTFQKLKLLWNEYLSQMIWVSTLPSAVLIRMTPFVCFLPCPSTTPAWSSSASPLVLFLLLPVSTLHFLPTLLCSLSVSGLPIS